MTTDKQHSIPMFPSHWENKGCIFMLPSTSIVILSILNPFLVLWALTGGKLRQHWTNYCYFLSKCDLINVNKCKWENIKAHLQEHLTTDSDNTKIAVNKNMKIKKKKKKKEKPGLFVHRFKLFTETVFLPFSSHVVCCDLVSANLLCIVISVGNKRQVIL